MNKGIEETLVSFALEEISFWEVMAWANEVDDEGIGNSVALRELRFIDEDLSDRAQIENSLLKMIPNSDEETISKLLLKENLVRVSDKRISSAEFVNFIIESVQRYEGDETSYICPDVYKIFNYYNGYGFADLSELSNDELVHEINGLLNSTNT